METVQPTTPFIVIALSMMLVLKLQRHAFNSCNSQPCGIQFIERVFMHSNAEVIASAIQVPNCSKGILPIQV